VYSFKSSKRKLYWNIYRQKKSDKSNQISKTINTKTMKILVSLLTLFFLGAILFIALSGTIGIFIILAITAVIGGMPFRLKRYHVYHHRKTKGVIASTYRLVGLKLDYVGHLTKKEITSRFKKVAFAN